MRIAIDILSAALGGPGQYILDLLPHLSRRAEDAEDDDELHVLAAHPTLLQRLPRVSNVAVHEIAAGRSPMKRLLWQRFAMPRWCRDHGIDVVFAPQGLTAITSGPPVVVLHQDSLLLSPERMGRSRLRCALQRHYARKTLSRAASALFVSKTVRDLAESRGWVLPAIREIVPYGVNIDELRDAADQALLASLRAGRPYVLNVNSVMTHKNVPTLVRAMGVLSERGRRDIRLLIAGEAPPERPAVREVMQLIERLGLNDVVTLLGPLGRPAVSAYYQAARAYVTVSHLEAFGLTPLEAMGLGAPAICSRILPFLEAGGDAALIVDGTDPQAVADAIMKLWDDEGLRAQLIERGRRRAAQFIWPEAADAVYRALQAAV